MNVNREDLVSLALGLLSAEEEARLRAALDADPALRAAYREDLETLHRLPDTLPPAEVPEGALERLMARVWAEGAQGGPAPLPLQGPADPAPTQVPPPTSRRRPLGPVLGGLALAAALAAGVLLLRPAPPADLLSEFRAVPGAVVTTLAREGAPAGQLVRLPDGRAYARLNSAPPEGRVYQLWRLENGQPVSAGVFSGQDIQWQGAAAGQTVAISVEPPGGSPQPTTTPLLVQQL
ncbi:anti-sigma factor [Deinococcus aquaedulcis]|uniref:anti-sigma factor n=1 Tax=Deinococcus aquaedulcis TaxID=2840455 RepID=UPI001C83F177|nr:anti-sigma factor [Deinococcus aquaedulcis]